MGSKLDNMRDSKFGIALFYSYLAAILVFGVFMVYALNHLKAQDAEQRVAAGELASLTQKACKTVQAGRIEGNIHIRIPLAFVLNQAANIVDSRTKGTPEHAKYVPTIIELRREAAQIKPLPFVPCQFEEVTK